jgi:hypothetical protein
MNTDSISSKLSQRAVLEQRSPESATSALLPYCPSSRAHSCKCGHFFKIAGSYRQRLCLCTVTVVSHGTEQNDLSRIKCSTVSGSHTVGTSYALALFWDDAFTAWTSLVLALLTALSALFACKVH